MESGVFNRWAPRIPLRCIRATRWGAPRDDLWMSDEYGYVLADNMGRTATNKIRVVYILGSADDAKALKEPA